jgi:hypothetical protein
MEIKNAVYAIVRRIVRIDPIWRVLDVCLRLPRLLDSVRRQVENTRGPEASALAALRTLCPDGRVRRGLCQGLRFPPDRSTFSTIAPMLLGLYERPLQAKLEHLTSTRGYDLMVNVGSADGFYAVGLALRCPAARVIACDTEPIAQRASRAMAEINDVNGRLQVTGFCDGARLVEFGQTAKRALILSDCEGFEQQLFSEGSGEALARHDVVIEMHDRLDYRISPHLRRVFESSHRVEILRADDDLQIVRTAHEYVPELAGYDWPTRQALVCENRRNVHGEWLIAISRVDQLSSRGLETP